MKYGITKIWKVLNLREKNQLIKLSILKVFVGIMDMVGVASIAPFIAVVSNQKILNENKIILKIKDTLNYENNELIIFFAVASLLLIIVNQFVRILGNWYGTYVSHNIWWSLNRQMFTYFINRPYNFHIQTNSNQLLEKLQVQTNAAVSGVVTPTFQIFGHIFTCIFLFMLLMIADPKVTSILLISVGLFYSIIFFKLKEKISTYGSFNPKYSQKTFKLVDQAYKSIKDIKIKDNAKFYVNIFEPLAKKYANNQVKINLIANLPRFFLEIFAYTFAFSIIIYFIKDTKNFSSIVILIGMYAFSLQKILPAIQGIYQQITAIKYFKPSFEKIYNDLCSATEEFKKSKSFPVNDKKINFSKKIEFKNVLFQYPNSKKEVLNIENLEIKAGTFLGITGTTGSGKTTLIDLLLGLLEPTSGRILIDGINLNQNIIKKWQSNVGYVPQFSFMADDTIKNNIALGTNETEINLNKIKNAANIAELSNFVEKELQLKYETIIGEDGIRLSGGQRQRISIARAFYNEQDVIVFDEATNSLDNVTEKTIIETILKDKKNKTIIMITHRLSSLQNCDEILFLENGFIEDKGSYENLIGKNTKFRNLANEINYRKN
tara:strand:+ start:19529 stop:21343 length:1815 start_codon:yes stop_codon:yes gene_type:complete